MQSGKTATTVDFLMERKVPTGGAFTIESEYSRYNGLGGYDANYAKSEGAYGLASFLVPKEVGIGKFEFLGKYADRRVHRRGHIRVTKLPSEHSRGQPQLHHQAIRCARDELL